MVLDFLAVDNFDFTRKIVKKNFGWKTCENVGGCRNWIFGQKSNFSNSVWHPVVVLLVFSVKWMKSIEFVPLFTHQIEREAGDEGTASLQAPEEDNSIECSLELFPLIKSHRWSLCQLPNEEKWSKDTYFPFLLSKYTFWAFKLSHSIRVKSFLAQKMARHAIVFIVRP